MAGNLILRPNSGRKWMAQTHYGRGSKPHIFSCQVSGGQRLEHLAAKKDWRAPSEVWGLPKAGSNIAFDSAAREGVIRGQTGKCLRFQCIRQENNFGRSVTAFLACLAMSPARRNSSGRRDGGKRRKGVFCETRWARTQGFAQRSQVRRVRRSARTDPMDGSDKPHNA
jgi:hypothetical protein